jgi:hypothetical protein
MAFIGGATLGLGNWASAAPVNKSEVQMANRLADATGLIIFTSLAGD